MSLVSVKNIAFIIIAITTFTQLVYEVSYVILTFSVDILLPLFSGLFEICSSFYEVPETCFVSLKHVSLNLDKELQSR